MAHVDPQWSIERIVDTGRLDAVMSIDAASFLNPWTREMFEQELVRPERSFLYAAWRTATEAIGYYSIWVVRDELHINTLAVRPEWRRRGVGRSLLGHAFALGTGRGAARATLEVRASNRAARELYARAGFVEEGLRSAYYTGPTEDAVVLWRELETG